jgi:acetyl-CoA synthetase
MNTVTWSPTEELIRSSNLFELMQEQNAKTFNEIHEWSVEHFDRFWERTIRKLGIRFSKPYQRLHEKSTGSTCPRWLVRAELNITESCFKRKGNEVAIIARRQGGPIERTTCEQLYQMSNRVANGLKDLGIHKGDAVALYLTMTAEAVAIYIGIVKMGGIVVSISESFPPEEITKRIRIGKAVAVFTQENVMRSGKCIRLYEKLCQAEAPRTVVMSEEHASDLSLREGDVHWDSFLSDNARFDTVMCSPQDAINLLFSSGTTGDPKAIPWDHTTPIKSASDAHYHHDIKAGDVVCWPTSLGWMMGPWLIFATLINNGVIALYDGTPLEPGFCQFVEEAGVSMLGVVPSIVRGWRKTGFADNLDWSSIRTFSSSGEASNAEDYEWLMQLNQAGGTIKPVVEYCGGTELGGGYLTSNLLTPQQPGEFNGKTMGIDFVVLDDDGLLCKPGEAGEVFLSVPSIGMSSNLVNAENEAVYYANCPRWNNTPLRRHGDRIVVCGKSRFKSDGRADNTMNLGGIKVGSTEIERCVSGTPGLVEVAAVGVPPEGGGADRLVLYVVTNGSDVISRLKAIFQQRIKEHLNPLFQVYDVVGVESLPRTASNKLLHRELRKRYQAAEAQG